MAPDRVIMQDFFHKCHIAIEWQSDLIEEDYSSVSNEVLSHSSIVTNQEILEEEKSNLDECLTKFAKEEHMEGDEAIHCSTCQIMTPHLKQLKVSTPPPFLTIQLKRFLFN